jgi:hypothetical protein
MPNALIQMRTWPYWCVGMGRSRIWKIDGGPRLGHTAAFIVSVMVEDWCGIVCNFKTGQALLSWY